MDFIRELAVRIKTFGDVSGLTKVGASVDTLTSKANKLGALLGAGFALHQMKAWVDQGVAFGDNIADTSKKIGLSAEELQKWQYIAEKAGASSEVITKAVGFLNKNLGEAQLGSKKANETFSKLGLGLKNNDGSWKDSQQILNEFADSMAALPNLAQRTAYAAKIGGKGAKELAYAFGQGSKAINETTKELIDMGGILDSKTADALDRHADRILLVKRSWEVLKSTLASGILPILTWINNAIGKTSKFLQDLEKKTGLVNIAFLSVGAGLSLVLLPSLLRILPILLRFSKAALIFTALYMAFEEVYYFFDKSKIGGIELFLQKLFGIEEGTKRMEALRTSLEGIHRFFTDDNANKAHSFWTKAFDGITKYIDGMNTLLLTLGHLWKVGEMIKSGKSKEAFDPNSAFNISERKLLYAVGDLGNGFKTKQVSKTDQDRLDFFNSNQLLVPSPRNNIATTNANRSVVNHNNITINGNDLIGMRNTVEEIINGKLIFAKENFITRVP